MSVGKNRWAIVLAAGEGTRLKSLTTNLQGVSVPKQFCAFGSPKSMLVSALERAERLVPRKRIVTVVSPEHECWWRRELSGYPEKNIVVQPKNRGTAAGILLPLIEILKRDSSAQIAIFPSDHYVEEEDILEKAFNSAMEAAHWTFRRLVLLGITPEEPDSQYGWIVPSQEASPIQKVKSFVEKPALPLAQDLFTQGALLNSFMFAAPAPLLLQLYLEIVPGLALPFLRHWSKAAAKEEPEKLEILYETLPSLDFSKDLLERAIRHLRVLAVPPCGWSDLGTPERVYRCWEQMEPIEASARGRPLQVPHLFEEKAVFRKDLPK